MGVGGDPNTLYFTDGIDGETHGPFGAISVVPEPSTWPMMLLGFAGLGFAFRQSPRKMLFA
jgi:PEP-CTERM motif